MTKLVQTSVINEMKEELRGKGVDLHQLLTSNAYRRFFIREAKYLTTKDQDIRFDLRADTAYATKEFIAINPILDLTGKGELNFADKTLENEGFFLHEVLHRLFTDFSLLNRIRSWAGNKELLKVVNNILEDSFIEWLGCILFPGDLKYAIAHLNQVIFEMSKPVEESKGEINMMVSALSLYGSTGKVKGIIPAESQDLWKDVKSLMDKGRKELSPVKRFRYAQDITLILESKMDTSEMTPPATGGKATYGEEHSSLGSKDKMSAKEVKEMLESMSPDDIRDMFEGMKEASDGEGTEGDVVIGIIGGEMTPGEGSASGKTPDVTVDLSKDGKSPGEEKSDEKTSTKETKPEESKKADKPSETSTPKGRTEEESKALMEMLESELREELVDEAVERLKTEALKPISETIKYGDMHRGVKNEITSSITHDIETKQKYDRIVSRYEDVIGITTRKFKKILKSASQTEFRKQRLGRFNSRDADQLFVEGRVFNRNKTFKGLDVVFTVLVDESGSMYGDRATNAREAAVVFQEVCEKINIPVMVMGFDGYTSREVTKHQIYKHFDTPKSLKHSTALICAKAENRDGYSIRFASEVMNKRYPEKNKVLIVISDGQPAHGGTSYGYYSSGVLEDVRHQIKRAEKKLQTDVIAVNISNVPGLHQSYFKNIVEVPSINELPEKLVALLKKEFKKYL